MPPKASYSRYACNYEHTDTTNAKAQQQTNDKRIAKIFTCIKRTTTSEQQ